ncbi:MAG: hypothetical protein OXU20_34370 [Myxococcales bacterium]|nr:hypothetical protein [Myxococcales bacterium]
MRAEDIDEKIARLVDLHHDDIVAPRAEDWRVILRLEPDQPIVIVNLLCFKASIPYNAETIAGATAHARYMSEVAEPFNRAGGQLIFSGGVMHMFPDAGVDASEGWESAVITRYPGPEALADMWLDPGFVRAHRHHETGVERSRVVVLKRPRMRSSRPPSL